jgi:hypothetical protein
MFTPFKDGNNPGPTPLFPMENISMEIHKNKPDIFLIKQHHRSHLA